MPKMTKTDYETQFSKESDLSKERMRQAGIEAVPCICGHDFCEGFLMVQDREAGREPLYIDLEVPWTPK